MPERLFAFPARVEHNLETLDDLLLTNDVSQFLRPQFIVQPVVTRFRRAEPTQVDGGDRRCFVTSTATDDRFACHRTT